MGARRVERGVRRGPSFEIEVDGELVIAHQGETVAAALLAAGRRAFRRTAGRREPRGLFCGIGLCFDCLVVIDGVPGRRACQTPATPGSRIQTQESAGPAEGGR